MQLEPDFVHPFEGGKFFEDARAEVGLGTGSVVDVVRSGVEDLCVYTYGKYTMNPSPTLQALQYIL